MDWKFPIHFNPFLFVGLLRLLKRKRNFSFRYLRRYSLHQFIRNITFDLFYWEYKLVRSFQKCIYVRTKWIDQLKYCPSLSTTFSHLSGNFRIPSQKNDSSLEAIQFWSKFSISAKEVNRWLVASEQPIIRRSNIRRIQR